MIAMGGIMNLVRLGLGLLVPCQNSILGRISVRWSTDHPGGCNDIVIWMVV